MAGVFLSYSRADRGLADQIVRSLRAVGVEAWWDEDMRGVDWQLELGARINELAAVVVIWTEHSAESVNVRDEARLALGKDKLINVMAGVRSPPFPYDRINGLPLDGWTGRDPHRGWLRVVETVEELVVEHGGAKPGEITVAQAMREQAIQGRQKEVSAAQKALQAAQARVDQSDADVRHAEEGAVQAQDQLQHVAQLKISPAVLKAAQSDFDNALEAKTRAEAARQAARAGFEQAATDLALAMDGAGGPVHAGRPAAAHGREPRRPGRAASAGAGGRAAAVAANRATTQGQARAAGHAEGRSIRAAAEGSLVFGSEAETASPRRRRPHARAHPHPSPADADRRRLGAGGGGGDRRAVHRWPSCARGRPPRRRRTRSRRRPAARTAAALAGLGAAGTAATSR